MYSSDIVWFCLIFLSSTLKKVLEYFTLSNYHLMLARILAPFACRLSNGESSPCKLLIIAIISGLKFCFLHNFCNLFLSLEILIFSCFVEFLEKVLKVLALSLILYLVKFHHSLHKK